MVKYQGWISAKLADKKLLRSLGIELGGYNFEENLWEDCIIPDTAIPLLDKHFGLFMYGIQEEIDKEC